MPGVEKISIALPPEMVARVREAVDAGEYASSSEVFRDALRDWTERRSLRQEGLATMRRMWQQAVANKSPAVASADVLDRLGRKYQARAAAARKAK